VLGGFLNGCYSLPMKRMHSWRWENIWLVYSIFGLAISSLDVCHCNDATMDQRMPSSFLATIAKGDDLRIRMGCRPPLFWPGQSSCGNGVGITFLGVSRQWVPPSTRNLHPGIVELDKVLVDVGGWYWCYRSTPMLHGRPTSSAEAPGKPETLAVEASCGLSNCVFQEYFQQC